MCDTHLNILLLGDSGVGKTSLLMRYMSNKFTESHISTLGVEYQKKIIKVDDKQVELKIQDTSGQDRFRAISKNYYKDVDGIMFVFDATNRESFEHINSWLKEVEENAANFEYIIVGNKMDLESIIDVNDEDVKEEYKDKKFLKTSAKTGEGVEEIFTELAYLILYKLIRTGSISNLDIRRNNSFYLSSQRTNSKVDFSASCCK